jgi:hypothetical protein
MLCLLSLNGSNYLLGGRQHQLPSPTPDFLAMVQAGMDPQTVCLSLLLNHLLTTLLPLQDPQEPSSKGMDLTLESKVIFFLYYYFTHALSFSIQVVMTWCSKSHT